jgi:GGDEF domain-containing protein
MHRIRDLAMTHVMTGLPNRSGLMTALDAIPVRRRGDGLPFTLSFLCLDDLKQVNGTLGLRSAMPCCRPSEECCGPRSARTMPSARLAAVSAAAGCRKAGLLAEPLRHEVSVRMRWQGRAVIASIGAMHSHAAPPSEAALDAVDALMNAAKPASRNHLRHAKYRTAPVLLAAAQPVG